MKHKENKHMIGLLGLAALSTQCRTRCGRCGCSRCTCSSRFGGSSCGRNNMNSCSFCGSSSCRGGCRSNSFCNRCNCSGNMCRCGRW